MFQLLLVFVLFTGVTYYVTFRRSRKRLYELIDTYPGPFDLPLIGTSYIGIWLNSRTIVEYLLKFIHTLPSPFRAWMGPYVAILFDQPKHLPNSQKLAQKSFFHKFFRFEKGLVNADHALWRVLRKRLGPPFAKQVVNDFVPSFNKRADDQLEYLDRFVGGEAVDMLPKMSVYVLSSTLANLFQVNLHTKSYDFIEKFAENSEKMWVNMYRRTYKPWLIPEFVYRLTPSYKLEVQQVGKIRALSEEIVEARKVLHGETPRSGNDSAHTETLIERLERLTYDTGELDYDTMMDNIDTFLFASMDTSSSTMASTLLMMAMHPDVQERVYREVSQVVKDDYVALEDLPNLEYLEQELQVDQWTIPVGAIVGVPILKIHRDRSIWGERSEEFDPDNFLPERCAQRHPYAYIPFSAGIRNCIGMRYAMISMKVVLAKMVKRYRFQTDLTMKDLKFEAAFLLMVANKHMVRIERR